MTADEPPADPAGAAISELSSRARKSNLARVEQLEAALQAAGEGRLDAEGRARAAELAHQVMGSAGTFGYPRASNLAGELERLLGTELGEDAGLAQAHEALAALRAELAELG